MILHIFQHENNENKKNFLSLLQEPSHEILLIDKTIFWLLEELHAVQAKIYALADSVKLFELDTCIKTSFQLIHYAQWVTLTEQSQQIITY